MLDEEDNYYKRNGKGKEYNEGRLIFEGEFFNDKRWNGKGKFYDDLYKCFTFEGEYLNGEKNGEGKEYNKNGLTFEGTYLYGERHGKRKEFFKNNNIKFEGEYLYGLKWNGIIYNYNQEVSFEIKDGKGSGKKYDFNGKMVN